MMGDILVGSLIAVAALGALAYIIGQRKRGKRCCGCSGCNGCKPKNDIVTIETK